MKRRWVFALAFLSALAAIGARAQGTARSQDLDTSVRAAGMGGASAAVDWGEPGVWGNPASLAGAHGVTWIQNRTKLEPELASDVKFDARRLVFGGSGIGVSVMGDPFDGVGRARLDYGSSPGTDPFGNPTGTFSSYEQIEGWGLGISPLQLFDAIRGAAGHRTSALSTRGDVAFGYQRKHTVLALAPAAPLGIAEADGVDWGVSARFPLVTDQGEPLEPSLDLSAGFAMLDANDERFDFGGPGPPVPGSRIRRMGVALHTAWPLTAGTHETSGPWSWWLRSAPRTVGLGFAVDLEHVTAGSSGGGYDVQHYGVEGTVLGLVTGRVGFVHDQLGEISDPTFGAGVHLPIGPWLSAGYDFASVPRPRGSHRLDRHGWSASFDPSRMWRDLTAGAP